jgi:hypothetical protein
MVDVWVLDGVSVAVSLSVGVTVELWLSVGVTVCVEV